MGRGPSARTISASGGHRRGRAMPRNWHAAASLTPRSGRTGGRRTDPLTKHPMRPSAVAPDSADNTTERVTRHPAASDGRGEVLDATADSSLWTALSRGAHALGLWRTARVSPAGGVRLYSDRDDGSPCWFTRSTPAATARNGPGRSRGGDPTRRDQFSSRLPAGCACRPRRCQGSRIQTPPTRSLDLQRLSHGSNARCGSPARDLLYTVV